MGVRVAERPSWQTLKVSPRILRTLSLLEEVPPQFSPFFACFTVSFLLYIAWPSKTASPNFPQGIPRVLLVPQFSLLVGHFRDLFPSLHHDGFLECDLSPMRGHCRWGSYFSITGVRSCYCHWRVCFGELLLSPSVHQLSQDKELARLPPPPMEQLY